MLFAQFAQLYARDLLKMINGHSQADLESEDEQEQRLRNLRYFEEQLLKHHHLYPEIQEHLDRLRGGEGKEKNPLLKGRHCQDYIDFWLQQCSFKVECLLIATTVSMEVWIVNKLPSIQLVAAQNEKLGQLFRKQEADVCFFDFLHLAPFSPAPGLAVEVSASQTETYRFEFKHNLTDKKEAAITTSDGATITRQKQEED